MQKSVEIVFPLNCSHPIFLDETAVVLCLHTEGYYQPQSSNVHTLLMRISINANTEYCVFTQLHALAQSVRVTIIHTLMNSKLLDWMLDLILDQMSDHRSDQISDWSGVTVVPKKQD